MNISMHVLAASFSLCALFHGPVVLAAQRDIPQQDAARLAQAVQWLGRLEGRFRLHVSDADVSAVHPPPPAVEGSGECRAVGAGPGVNCLFEYEPRAGQKRFVLLLLGLDAEGPAIRVMHLASGGVPMVSRAVLEGDRVTFTNDCASYPPGSSCTHGVQIHAPGNGRFVEVVATGRAVPQPGEAASAGPALRMRMELQPDPAGR